MAVLMPVLLLMPVGSLAIEIEGVRALVASAQYGYAAGYLALLLLACRAFTLHLATRPFASCRGVVAVFLPGAAYSLVERAATTEVAAATEGA